MARDTQHCLIITSFGGFIKDDCYHINRVSIAIHINFYLYGCHFSPRKTLPDYVRHSLL